MTAKRLDTALLVASLQDIEALIEDGAIVAEEIGGAWLVELQSLSEYRDALWEVLTDGQD